MRLVLVRVKPGLAESCKFRSWKCQFFLLSSAPTPKGVLPFPSNGKATSTATGTRCQFTETLLEGSISNATTSRAEPRRRSKGLNQEQMWRPPRGASRKFKERSKGEIMQTKNVKGEEEPRGDITGPFPQTTMPWAVREGNEDAARRCSF